MKLSEYGKTLIKNFEGLRLNAYRDAAGVWTIGYGSTRYHDGKAIKPNDRLANEQQAAALLANTLDCFESAVQKKVIVPLTQNQFDALVSFTYNVGDAALASSTLLKKLNAGNYSQAAEQFLVWNKITDSKTGEKRALSALTDRRKKERQLFLKT